MRTMGLLFGISIAAVACLSDSAPPSVAERERDACVIGGCSAEVCADQPAISTCIYRPRNDCFADAICERQDDRGCGWTVTRQLQACLDAHPE
jgi:hypothetical protein